jgi:hypothetical protein
MISPFRLLLSTVLSIVFGLCAQAQNLFSNPSFESGDFTGWTANGAIVSSMVGDFSEGSKGAVLNVTNLPTPMTATLSQTISTMVGKSYVIGFDYNGSSVIGGGSLAVQGATINYQGPLPVGTIGFQRVAVVFTADSTNTTVTLSLTAVVGPATAKFDKFSGAEAIYSKPGKYTGNLRRTTSIAGTAPGRTISSSSMQTIAARIDASGKLTAILQPFGFVSPGFVLDSKAINFNGAQGMATTVGVNIKFTNTVTLPPGAIGNLTGEAITLTDVLVLRRVGN